MNMLSKIRKKILIETFTALPEEPSPYDDLLLKLFKFFHKKEVENLKQHLGESAESSLPEPDESVWWSDFYNVCKDKLSITRVFRKEYFSKHCLHEFIKSNVNLPDFLSSLFSIEESIESDPHGNSYITIDLELEGSKEAFMDRRFVSNLEIYKNYYLLEKFMKDDYEPYNLLKELKLEIFPYKARI